MANKFLDWVDRKGVPIMSFITAALLSVFILVQIVKLFL